MNLYFVLEGEQTEKQAYPFWLGALLPNLTQAKRLNEVTQNHYYLFAGGGIPAIYTHIKNAILTINEAENPKFNYLVAVLDCDELSAEQRKTKLLSFLEQEKTALRNGCELVIIAQTPCIETWFLGNRPIVKRNPENQTFKEYYNFYKVNENCPEKMPTFGVFKQKSLFHFKYLREMLAEHAISYSKNNPFAVLNQNYLQELQKRTNEANDLPSLRHFFDFLTKISNEMRENKTDYI